MALKKNANRGAKRPIDFEKIEREESSRREASRKAGIWPEYHENSLFYAAVVEVMNEFQVPIEMAMMTALGAISCVCHDMIDVELPTGNKTVPSLMLLTIAKSGERKTTVQKQFFRAITKHNRDAILEHQRNLEKHEAKRSAHDSKRKGTEQALKKCLKDKKQEEAQEYEQALEDIYKDEPIPPRSKRILYSDTTPQALVEAMYNHSPSACLLTSEANSLFSGHAFNDLDKINTLWDGDDVIVDRTTRPSFILMDSRLTLSIMAQPVVVERFLSKRGEEARGIGFLARFITVMAEEKAGSRNTHPIGNLDATELFNQRIQSLIGQYFDKEPPQIGMGKDDDNDRSDEISELSSTRRKELTFTSSAKGNWYKYHQEIEWLQAPNQALFFYKDHASKLMENVVRMAALLHYFEDTSGEKNEIDAYTLDFSYDFCRIASQHFQKHLAGTPQVIIDANDIVEKIFIFYEKEKEEKEKKEQENKSTNPKPAPDYGIYPHSTMPYITHMPEKPPYHGVKGREYRFKLAFLKRFGPYALRGRIGHKRLMEALDFLKRMRHVKQEHNDWFISESLYGGPDEPLIRNGIDFTVENLPLFEDQAYWYSAGKGTPTRDDHWQIKYDC